MSRADSPPSTSPCAEPTREFHRERLRKVPKHVDGTRDVYLFPDEERYRGLITQKLQRPLDIQLEIRDEDGKPTLIDEQQ